MEKGLKTGTQTFSSACLQLSPKDGMWSVVETRSQALEGLPGVLGWEIFSALSVGSLSDRRALCVAVLCRESFLE